MKLLLNINKDRNIYFMFLLLLILDRMVLLTNFNFKYVGSDDLIFWQGATDYMKGKFYEPYFYGQNYNFMLEALFAVPFLKLGVPYFYTFPIATSFVALFPFVFISIVLKKNDLFIESIFFLVLPVLLPIEYGILTSVTRGFVSGLFFSSFLIFSLLSPNKKSSWFLATLAFAFGFIFNPNSLVITFPVCLYLLFVNWKRTAFYLISFITVLPVLSIEFFSKMFYQNNQDYNVNGMWQLQFDFKMVFDNLKHLDNFFAYSTPLFWFAGWSVLLIILFIGFFLLKKDKYKGFSLLFGIAFILLTLGINKVNDHIDSIFLSSTRMFLGVPILAGLAFTWTFKHLALNKYQLIFGIAFIAFTTFFIKTSVSTAVIKLHTVKTNFGPVAIKKSNELICECEKLDSISVKHQVSLFAFVPTWNLNVPHMEFYNYGCPLLNKKFPSTMMNIYEKRTWVYIKEKESIHKNILIFGSSISTNTNEIKQNDNYKGLNIEVISENPTIILIKNNVLTIDSLFKKLSIDLKRNAYS
jgi:hypothetical protein